MTVRVLIGLVYLLSVVVAVLTVPGPDALPYGVASWVGGLAAALGDAAHGEEPA